MRRRLSERLIEGLKAPPAKRYLVYDTVVPSLAVRVSKRHKTFVVVGRFGKRTSSRHSLGSCVSMTLEQAREKARNYQAPKHSDTFGEVANRFFAHIATLRRGYEVERSIRRELMPRWGNKPIANITRRDVIEVVDAIKARGAACTAYHVLGYAKRAFNFAIARDILGHSPCDRVRAAALVGPKVVRQRVLNDDEIRLLWSAAARIAYPYGPYWRLALVTGQRKTELSHAQWREVDTGRAVWTIPPERFKSNATHTVPLSPLALEIIASLPRTNDYLFGMPLNGFASAKERLDKEMGDNIPHFVIHDIRRTVRTRLSALRVPYEVAEMVIGHGKKGLARVYDQHYYHSEMREALDAWATNLKIMVQ
jgi:integrase